MRWSNPLREESPMLLIRLPTADPAHDHDEARTCARIIGEEATGLYPGQPWGVVEPYMADEWCVAKGRSRLTWPEVRNEAHAAWQLARLEREGRLQDNAPLYDSVAA